MYEAGRENDSICDTNVRYCTTLLLKGPLMEIKRISPCNGKHHLFGFHDLVQTNAKGDFALSLEVDDISHPPLPGEKCSAGVIDLATGAFRKLHDTRTWNYPQGARQQWLGDSDFCLCNDREDDGSLVCRISDARKGCIINTLPFPVHCVAKDGTTAVYVDYDRLYAVGGYGYVPLTTGHIGRIKDLPDDSGLWVGDLQTGRRELIASVLDVAKCDEKRAVRTGFPHYITHPILNPSRTRVAFLHEYRVVDGGDISRLIVCDLTGRNMHCLAKGLVSHFTWVDDNTVFAWGSDEKAACRLRESRLFLLPGGPRIAKMAKSVGRCLRNSIQKKKVETPLTSVSPLRSFLFLHDEVCENKTSKLVEKTGIGILTEDGHPMACPRNRRIVVCDTYPDVSEERQLFLYDVDKEEKKLIGKFGRLMSLPDLTLSDVAMNGVDLRVKKAFGVNDYMFTRSGIHCDLHPRWSYDGAMVFFDSTHEGTRQIYVAKGLEF